MLALLSAAGAWAFASLDMNWNWGVVWDYRAAFWQGWWMTVVLSLASLLTSSLIGVTAAVMLRSSRPLVQAAARVYVELIRGTPLLVQLLV